MAAVAAACAPVETLPPAVSNYCIPTAPASAPDYQTMFDGLRKQYTEWAASDGSIPVDLSSSSLGPGSLLWLFGDTIVGRVKTDGSVASGWKFIHDSAVLQMASGPGACVMPLMGGARGARTDFIANPTPGNWYWPTGGIAENGGTTLNLFMYDVAPDPSQPSPFNWKIVGIDVATYSLPGLQLTGTPKRLLPPASPSIDTPFGEHVLDGGDGYLYAYGHTGKWLSTPAHHYVARVPLGTETSASPAWEFWDGTTWAPSESQASPMLFDPDGGAGPQVPADDQGPFDALRVIAYTDSHGTPGFLATAKLTSSFDDEISTWFAPTPTGPWSYVGVAKGNQPTGATFTYAPQIWTGLAGSGPMLIWSQNHDPLDPDVIANNQLYKAIYDSPDGGALP